MWLRSDFVGPLGDLSPWPCEDGRGREGRVWTVPAAPEQDGGRAWGSRRQAELSGWPLPHPPQKYPQPKGQKKKKIVKYGMGGLIILFLVAIIWFPLLFMSLVRSVVGVVNQPIDVTVTLKLGGYEPLFTMSAQQPSIVPFTDQAYEELSRQFDPHPVSEPHAGSACGEATA